MVSHKAYFLEYAGSIPVPAPTNMYANAMKHGLNNIVIGDNPRKILSRLTSINSN